MAYNNNDKDVQIHKLVFPSSERYLVVGKKNSIKKSIESAAKCEILIYEDGDSSADVTAIISTHSSLIQNAVKMFIEHLVKSDKLIKVKCAGHLADFINDMNDYNVFNFQREHDIFIDFNASGEVFLKGWTEDKVDRAAVALNRLVANRPVRPAPQARKANPRPKYPQPVHNHVQNPMPYSQQAHGTQHKPNFPPAPGGPLNFAAFVEVEGCCKIDEPMLKLIKEYNQSSIIWSLDPQMTLHIQVTSPSETCRQNAISQLTALFKDYTMTRVRYEDLRQQTPQHYQGQISREHFRGNPNPQLPFNGPPCYANPETTIQVEDKTKFPKYMNILMLGETGVGKSTFINGLVNYMNYDSVDDALNLGVHVCIKSSFTITDDDYQTREIVTEPTIQSGRDASSNEQLGSGQSSTQDPKTYKFSFMHKGEEKHIRIIDTPGIGDTRGIEQDKKNFDKILSFISNFPELHAVCILIKPNTSRLTLAFRFCIDELLVHLHRSCSRNIVFCFTNTRGTLYKPGDTLPTLREHLAKLKGARGIDIPLNKSTLFCFDNESMKFLCAKKVGEKYTQADEDSLKSSWTKSVEETKRLLNVISELPVHSVSDTLCINNTRQVILTLARPLAEAAKMVRINIALIEDKIEEVKRHVAEGKSLEGKLYVEQMKTIVQELNYPRTVCTAAKCVEYKRFSANPNAALETDYKTICHDHCYLQGVQVENCPNVMLQQCWAMHASGGQTCRGCECPWSTHMHIRYKLEHVNEKVVDPTVQESIKKKDDIVKSSELFVKAEQQKVAEYKAEIAKINQHCAEFAAFLNSNSILPYNDSYGQYIDHLIKEEEDKVSAGGPRNTLDDMYRYKSEYQQEVSLLNKSMKSHPDTAPSVKDIDDKLAELNHLKYCGDILKEVKNLELLKLRQTQEHDEQVVKLNSKGNFFGKVANTIAGVTNSLRNAFTGQPTTSNAAYRGSEQGFRGRGGFNRGRGRAGYYPNNYYQN